jgi:hypothetical protein
METRTAVLQKRVRKEGTTAIRTKPAKLAYTTRFSDFGPTSPFNQPHTQTATTKHTTFLYLLNCPCVRTRPSSRIGNFTSQLPTIFWILKSRNFACGVKNKKIIHIYNCCLNNAKSLVKAQMCFTSVHQQAVKNS